MLQIDSKRVSDFFNLVEENFEIRYYQMISDFFTMVEENTEIRYLQNAPNRPKRQMISSP